MQTFFLHYKNKKQGLTGYDDSKMNENEADFF